MVEQRTENPRVGGSIPSLAICAKLLKRHQIEKATATAKVAVCVETPQKRPKLKTLALCWCGQGHRSNPGELMAVAFQTPLLSVPNVAALRWQPIEVTCKMDHGEFLQIVYDRFRTTGKWPRVRDLQIELRDKVNVRALALDAGLSKVVCESRPAGECFLHLEGIVECKDAQEDIENFLATVRLMARRYVSEGASRITKGEIDQELGLGQLASVRLARILLRVAGIAGGSSGTADDATLSLELTEDTLWYENVATIDEFMVVRRRVRHESAELTAKQWTGPNPSFAAATATGELEATPEFTADVPAASFSQWMLLHDSVVTVARSLFETGHYADAVFAAFRELNTVVKAKSGQRAGNRDGADLMTFAFSKENPWLILADRETESGRSEQLGYMHLFAGSMIGIRNPKAHANVKITAERALHQLFLASLLFSKLDEARLREE